MADEKKIDLTEVVEKVAQFQYERFSSEDDSPPWNEVPAMAKFYLKESVTPLVVATLLAANVETA